MSGTLSPTAQYPNAKSGSRRSRLLYLLSCLFQNNNKLQLRLCCGRHNNRSNYNPWSRYVIYSRKTVITAQQLRSSSVLTSTVGDLLVCRLGIDEPRTLLDSARYSLCCHRWFLCVVCGFRDVYFLCNELQSTIWFVKLSYKDIQEDYLISQHLTPNYWVCGSWTCEFVLVTSSVFIV